MILAAALAESVKARARALGFDLVAIGPAGPPAHAAELRRWVEAGFAGSMGYMARRLADRLDVERVLPGASTAVCVALNYYQGERAEDATWAPVARYAWGRDYHEVMRPRLEALNEHLENASGCRGKVYVDTGPVPERDLAAQAGLGWVGKNTMLIHPELGSWFFVGVVLTTAELPRDAALPDRCGSCRACLDACPTEAFVEPHVLDARRCIAYLTIEHRGDIDPALRPLVGAWEFGCDVCQTVCPWNRKAPETREPAFRPGGPYPGAAAVAEMDDAASARAFAGTALTRARPAGMRRNARLALENRSTSQGGDP